MSLSGTGCYVIPPPVKDATSPLDRYLLTIPADKVLQKGIALSDIAAFMDTQSGSELFHSFGSLSLMKPGTAAWVPFGVLALPLAIETAPVTGTTSKDKKELKKSSSDTAIFVFASSFDHELAADCDAGVQNAIATMHHEHLMKVSSKFAWSARAAISPDFLAKVIAVKATGTT